MPSRPTLPRALSRFSHRAVPFCRCLLLASALGFGLQASAGAHDYRAGDIVIGNPYARSTVPGQPSAGAYISIENKGRQPDTLTSVSTAVAKSAEIHTMAMDGNIMKMREVGSVDIKPSEKIAMAPGNGVHLMLVGLSKPLKAGDSFPMTLTFKKAGKIDVSVAVEAFGTGDAAGHSH